MKKNGFVSSKRISKGQLRFVTKLLVLLLVTGSSITIGEAQAPPTCSQLGQPACSQVSVSWATYDGTSGQVLGDIQFDTATGTNQATKSYTGIPATNPFAGLFQYGWGGQAQASPTNVVVSMGGNVSTNSAGGSGVTVPMAATANTTDLLWISSDSCQGPGICAKLIGSNVIFTAQVSGVPAFPPLATYSFGLLEQLIAGQGSAVVNFGAGQATLADIGSLKAKTQYYGPAVPISVFLGFSMDYLQMTCATSVCSGGLSIDPSITGITLTTASGESVPITVISASGASYGSSGAVPGFYPTQILQNLISLINSFGLQKGITGSLNAKLNAAIAALGASDVEQACSDLTDLITETTSQSGKLLAPAEAKPILVAVPQIQSGLGCSPPV